MSVANMGDPTKLMFVNDRTQKKNIGILTDYRHQAQGFTVEDASHMSDKEIYKRITSRIMGLLGLFKLYDIQNEKQ